MKPELNYLMVTCYLWVNVVTLFADEPQGFIDVTPQTGITFVHDDGARGDYFIAETVTAGLGLFDYDNDGDLDIYFVNGTALVGEKRDPEPINQLYRNDGNFQFTDVSHTAGVGDNIFGLGCAMGDVNNDGWLDLYVSNFAEDVFYLNQGDGTFVDATEAFGLGDPRVGAGVSFGDYNADGWLDLFVANYVHCPLDETNICDRLGVPLYCDPSTFEDIYEPQASSFYLNDQGKKFIDYSETAGINQHLGRGMGISSTDYDNDGDLDIYVANDVNENFLYQNNGDGTFEEWALFSGTALDYNGRPQGSMGCDFGDYNNDGLFDILVTSYQNQINTLYENMGGGLFRDVSIQSGISQNAMKVVSWACFFFDYDNDGDQDVFVAHGHLQDNIEKVQPSISYPQHNQLFENQGDGTFQDVTDQAGPGLQVLKSTRGGAFGDLNNDGRLDIVLSNSRDSPTVLQNNFINDNHWINIKLEGTTSNRAAVGARVSITAVGKTQINEVRAGSSYQSHYDLRLHFGLGEADQVEQLTVRWPNGDTQEFKNIKSNQFVLIREGDDTVGKQ